MNICIILICISVIMVNISIIKLEKRLSNLEFYIYIKEDEERMKRYLERNK